MAEIKNKGGSDRASGNPEKFRHVSDLWDETRASAIGDDPVGLLLYRSNILGADLRITNYGGGNTSCKCPSRDPLTGLSTEVMWIKGSGGDLGSLNKSGLAALYMDRLNGLKKVYRGLAHEDEMVGLLNLCLFYPESKAPSIDTPLHAFLPFRHIDHLHPDAVIALAAARDGEKIIRDLFGGKMGWIGWQRPGFDLGLRLSRLREDQPDLRGIVLGSHGLFTWGDTSRECYLNTLDAIETCADFLEKNTGKRAPVFGGQLLGPLPKEKRRAVASRLAPVLRGLVSGGNRMVGHFTDAEPVLEFLCSRDLHRLAPKGTSCPDHFLRTKISPLILDWKPEMEDAETGIIRERFEPLVENYRELYKAYYAACRYEDSPQMRDPNPVILLCPGVGMFSFARDKQTARVAAEFYLNAIQVMRGAEAVSEYLPLPRQEAFDIEYWLLEEAKLRRMPKPKPLSGRIALVTGSAGGIGKAIARKFAEEGACVLINDNDEKRLSSAVQEFSGRFGKDQFASVLLDVTRQESIRQAMDKVSLDFGGLDMVVNCAGISISKPLEEHTVEDWDLLYDILVKGQFLVTQMAVALMRRQGTGGDILNVVSKNALVSGPNNAAYGSAKAAQLHLGRLNAAELGKDHIRVNTVNPDAVISDSKIWEGAWAEGRAKAYGIRVEDLPAYYAKRTLLNEIILPEDIANACFAFVGGLLNKSTGNMLNVDGGVAVAFPR
jgi:rhamnulose-1-phosphate aldolase/alcohol dehydrogenase